MHEVFIKKQGRGGHKGDNNLSNAIHNIKEDIQGVLY